MTEMVVFDFDGTLYRDEDSAREAFDRGIEKRLIEQHGISQDQAQKLRRQASRQVGAGTPSTAGILASSIDGIDTDALVQAGVEAIPFNTITTRFDVLEATRDAGYRTAILTNNTPAIVEAVLQRHGTRVETVIGHTDLPALKPEQEAFEAFLARTGLAADETVMVDDQARNLDAARSLGMGTVHVHGSGSGHRTIQSLAQLPEAVV